MSISALPAHLLFNIIVRIVATYIDTAIASPPAPRWMHRFSKSAIILVRDFLATQVKNGLREPPHVPVGSNLTEWSDITEDEFLAILRELVGENELDSFLLPDIPEGFDDYYDELDDDGGDGIPNATMAENDNPRDDAVEGGLPSVPSPESTNVTEEVTEEVAPSTVTEGEKDCDSAGKLDSLVPSENFVAAEETKELAEGMVDTTVMGNDTPCEGAGRKNLESHSPVPLESLTMLGSPKEHTAEIVGVVSPTGAEDEKPANVNASDDDVLSDTDSGWTEVWFQEWFAVEEREPLPKNIVVHLMGVNGAFREATLKAINIMLGIKRGRKKM